MISLSHPSYFYSPPECLLLIFVSIIPYLNSLRCNFAFDDFSAILENPDLRSNQTTILDLFYHDFWGTPLDREESHKSYRPLTVLTFRWQFSLHGLNATYLNAVNVILHSVVSVFYYLLLKTISDQNSAFLAALVFAVHPIHTEAVAGLVGRAELLAALFFVVGLLIHIRSSCGFFTSIIVVIIAFLATFSKEQGITLLPACIVWDACNYHDRSRMLFSTILQNVKTVSFWLRILPFIIGAIGILTVRIWMLDGSLPIFSEADNPASNALFPIRHYTYAYIWTLNSWLLLCPNGLCADWSMGTIKLVSAILDHRNLSTAAFLIAYFSIPVHCLRSPSQRLRLVFYSFIACHVIPFIPASNIFFPVGFVIAERTLYIPSFGYSIIMALGYRTLLERFTNRPSTTLMLKSIFWIMISLFCLKTSLRNVDWNDDYSLFTSALKFNSNNAKSFNNVGYVLEKRGDQISARQYFLQATRVQPDDIGSWINVGRIETLLGHYDSAELALKRALTLLPAFGSREARIAPQHLNVFISLGNLYKNQSRMVEAESVYRRAISMRKDFSSAYMNFGDLLMATNRIPEALDIFKCGLKYDTKNADLWYNVGIALMKLNRSSEALPYFDHALSLNGDHFYALVNSALLLLETASENRQIILDRLKNAVSLKPDSPEVAHLHVQIGNLHYGERQLENAEYHFERASILDPANRVATLNLAIVRSDLGNVSNATWLLERMLERHPDFVKGWITLCGLYSAASKNTPGALEKAYGCYQQVLTLDSNNALARHNLCITLINLMRKDEAISCIDRARDIASHNVNVSGLNFYTSDYVRVLENKLKITFDHG